MTLRASVMLALFALLAGCASTLSSSSPAHTSAAQAPLSRPCAATVLETLGGVLDRVYHEGVASERTAAAEHLIAGSVALREAVEDDNAPAARAAAAALIATGHMTNLRVIRAGHTLVDLGGPALVGLRGSLLGIDGAPIGTYVTSVWADSSFIEEGDGIAEGSVVLRAGRSSIGGRGRVGSFALPPRALPDEGTLTRGHVVYRYTSFPAQAFPSGALRIYLVRTLSSIAPLCGHSSEDTLVNTLIRVAKLIYAAESGGAARAQVMRVQHNRALLAAVARRDPEATRLAIDQLLNQHIVRMRVSAGAMLLADVGGPFVLAPVHATLRLHGRTIGSFVLSVQDDEGYLRLARRLAGLHVLMYVNPPHLQLVKNSVGPAPGTVPAGGPYHYRGSTFDVFTLHAQAFPSGPLLIRVLVPIPYPTHAGASDPRLASRASRSSRKESPNFSTPSRSSVSVTSS
jgi:hypothetical protein